MSTSTMPAVGAETLLIQRAQKGDKAASDKLVRRYFQQAKRACRLHASLKGIDDAEATSATYEVILVAIRDFRAHAGASFLTFLDVKARGAMTALARNAASEAKLACELTLEGGVFETASGVPERQGRSDRERAAAYQENWVAERIDALRGPRFLDEWISRRKGNDPINQDIARMLWRDQAPAEIGEPIRHYTAAEVADELHVSVDTVRGRRAKIIEDLTGKSEEELLAARVPSASPARATAAPKPVRGLTNDAAIAALAAHFDEVLRHGFDFDGSDSDRIGGSLLDDLRLLSRACSRHHRGMQTDIRAAAVRLADLAENEIRNYAGPHYDRLRTAIAVIRNWHP